jgi:hypothetical protein
MDGLQLSTNHGRLSICHGRLIAQAFGLLIGSQIMAGSPFVMAGSPFASR